MMENRLGISGNTLKMIALITMLIDHIGAVILNRIKFLPEFNMELWERLYWPLRGVGRLAFPIFCFLLVEGFIHTKNKGKYLFRMLIFAIISEIPFNLAISGNLFDVRYQNVYWELALGLMAMWLIWIMERRRLSYPLRLVWSLVVLTTFMMAAQYLSLDYGLYGILSIVVIYLSRRGRLQQAVAGAITFTWELPAPLAFLPILAYNGKRGRGIKYAFYIFYPAHLLILYIIARAIGCPF